MIERIISSAARQLTTKLKLLSRAMSSWEAILWGVAIIMTALIVPLRYEIGQNGDGLLQTLMSLQHLTFFFWGQDRFANLVPWLTSFIRDPTTNAQLQLAIRIGLGIAAPLLFSAPYATNQRDFSAVRATLLATALALAFMPQRLIHELFIEASPYGSSFALSGFALLLFSAGISSGRAAGIVFRVAGLILTFAAYAVNASLVLVTVPMFALLVLLSDSLLALEFAIASVVAGTSTLILAAATNVTHTTMRFGETLIGVTYYLQEMAGKTGIFLISMSVLFIMTSIITTAVTFKHSFSANRLFVGYGLVLLTTFVAVFLGVSLSSWVVMNYLHPRYLVPLFCMMATLGAISILHLIEWLSTDLSVKRRASLVLCLLLLAYAGTRSLSPVPEENEIVLSSVRALSSRVADIVTDLRLDAVAGNYWVVWPSVFLAEQQAFDLGRPPGQIFGVAERGSARRQAFAARLFGQGHLNILCVETASAQCAEEASKIIGKPLGIDNSSVVGGVGHGDSVLNVLTLVPR